MFGLIQTNALQMGHLIDDLLSFSRLNQQPLKVQDVDTKDLVEAALSDLMREAGRSVVLDVQSLPKCRADPSLLRQVFQNLLSNAIKYTQGRPQTTRIEIGSRRQGGECVYFVRDNGVGFDMVYADKVFGVFQRLHSAAEFEGTGVGLAIVQRIVHRHGGRIWADAEVDKGAMFSFVLGEGI